MVKFNKNDVKIGISPIGWSNDEMQDLGAEYTFKDIIDDISELGYEGTEIGMKFPRDPKILKAELDKRKLVVCNAWYSTHFTIEERYQETIDNFIKHMKLLAYCGAKVIGIAEQGKSIQKKSVSIFDNSVEFNDKEWKLLIKGVNQIAQIAKENGMKVCYHHHMGTGVQTNRQISKFMDNVSEDVYLLYDTGHIYLSEKSQETLNIICKKYADRIIHIHLKDVDPEKLKEAIEKKWSFHECVRYNIFHAPGYKKGAIDFDKIFEIVHNHQYKGWILIEAEGDPKIHNPREVGKISRKWLKEHIGV